MTDIWIFDVEGDGLKPTKLHCLSAGDPKTGKVFTTPDHDSMRKFLKNAKVLVGHHITRFDIPVLERLLGIKIKAKLIDTLALSWYLYPQRLRHGLEGWGEDLGIKKPEITDWENLSQEEYEHRCSEDVKINMALWNQMYKYLLDIYGSDKEIWKLLDYIAFKMKCARLQEESKWKLDIEYIKNSLSELTAIQEEKKVALTAAMPKVPMIVVKRKPKVFLKSDGEYSKLGMDWIALCTKNGLPPTNEDDIPVLVGEEEGNPSSTDQLKEWLYSLGWVPQTFKTTKNKLTGATKEIPQINLEHGKGICPSIKKLYEKEPSLELLEGLSVLQHRIGILNGFLRDQEDGWIKAQINGLTNTLRFKHTTVVNLPKVDKLYAASIRGGLICPEGYEQCGADLSSLEDKLKQHYIFPLDPDYVNEMQVDDYDPHLSLAFSAHAITKEQMDDYISGIDKKTIKPIRDIYKNGNYACQYLAGVSRLAITCGISFSEAKVVHEAYWKKNWSVKKVAEQQRYKTVEGQMWLFNPISELWYSLRYEKDIFSTLVQGSGAYVFDKWVEKILDKREQLTFQFHDELGLTVKKGFRESCTKLIKESLEVLNKELKLNIEILCDVQYGDRYSEIH
jgi:DNA polymerase I-like protein with 3'-5' exonuclease and polymerase domains